MGHYLTSAAAFRADMGRRIRFLRSRAGIRQIDLARRLGIDPAAVTRWEQGRAAPENPEAVAKALGLSSLAEFYVVAVPPDDADEED